MAIALVPCPCGGVAELDMSERRRAKRHEADEHLSAAERADHRRGEGLRTYQRAQIAVQALQKDVFEVRCADCGRWVWAETGERAANRWNRAVEKLEHLDECCQHATDRRVDYDGMVIVRCETCGRRHFPLDPDDADVEATDEADDRRTP